MTSVKVTIQEEGRFVTVKPGTARAGKEEGFWLGAGYEDGPQVELFLSRFGAEQLAEEILKEKA